MPKFYSQDMRAAALACVARGERREDIVKFFGISLKTLSNWGRLERETGDLTPNKRGAYRTGESARTCLSEALSEQKDATLDELAARTGKHRTTIFYHLNQMNVTRKKNHAIRRTK